MIILRRLSRFLTDTDNINIILGIIGVALVVSLTAPEVVPGYDLGARCTNLPNARGGNRQSLLAQGAQNMAIRISVVDTVREGDEVIVSSGEPITIRVSFENRGKGPITLFYNEDALSIGNIDTLPAGTLGIVLEFTAEINDGILVDTLQSDFIQTNPAATIPTYDYDREDLYLLRAGGACFVEVRLSAERLNRIRLTPGEYRLRAYYQNQDQGLYIPPTPNEPIPTPTPMFEDANVWSGGRLQSNRLILTVQQ